MDLATQVNKTEEINNAYRIFREMLKNVRFRGRDCHRWITFRRVLGKQRITDMSHNQWDTLVPASPKEGKRQPVDRQSRSTSVSG